MLTLAEYAAHDGLGLAELVRRGETTPPELAQVALQAIRRLNPTLNAVIETFDDAADTAPPDGPFGGVPFLLKDIGSHDGNTTFELGSRIARGMKTPPQPCELVQRFRSSGVTVLGRTNIPELGVGCTTEPLLYGPTRNPWNLERSSGGSSGGAAAAVAAGIVPIAHANDAGGSIRVPASMCGLVGLKPSRNLNPVGPYEGLALHGLAAEHIVSRTVRDTAAMLDVTAGPDSGPFCFTPRLNGSYLAALTEHPKGLRIGLNLQPNFPPTALSADAVEAVRATARLCESLGHQVEETTLEFDHDTMMRAMSTITVAGLHCGINHLAALNGRPPSDETLEPHTLLGWAEGKHVTSEQLINALSQLNVASRTYGQFFRKYDLMLTPTTATEPFELGMVSKLPMPNFHDWFFAMAAQAPFTATANAAGIPAISLPLSLSSSGLPMGSHFLAPMGSDLLLLQLAAQLEEAAPWSGRRPAHHITSLS